MTAIEAPAGVVIDRSRQSFFKQWKAAIAYGAIALVSLIVFGLNTAGGVKTGFAISRPNDTIELPQFSVPSQTTALTLSVVLFALAAFQVWAQRQARTVGVWLPIVIAIVFMAALMTWAGAGKDDTNMAITGLLVSGVFLAVPLVFGAMAGTLCERSGIVNIAIEGQLLGGAFLAAVVASVTDNAYLGMLAPSRRSFTIRRALTAIFIGLCCMTTK
jgi:simple sugar transport system permease protein